MKQALGWIALGIALLAGVPTPGRAADLCLQVTALGLSHTLFLDVEGVTTNGYANLNGQDKCLRIGAEASCSPLNGTAYLVGNDIHFGTITHGGMGCPNPVTIEGVLSGTSLGGSGTLWNHDTGFAVPVTFALVPCPTLQPPCHPS